MDGSTQSPRYAYSPIWERPAWKLPGGARLALLLYLNIEHFPYDQPQEADHVLSLQTKSYAPDVLNHSWRDYGLRVGLWRLTEMLERLEITPTIMLNADVCREYPQIIRYGRARAWDWVAHGRNTASWTTQLPRDEERALIQDTIDTIAEAVGTRPRGWFSQRISESHATPDLLAELGVEYLCDYSADDQPFPVTVSSGSLLSIPYNVQIVDVVPVHGKGNTPAEYADILRDQFSVLYAEGEMTARILPISLHPFVMGQAFRIPHLERVLGEIVRHEGVWRATASEVCDWWRATRGAG